MTAIKDSANEANLPWAASTPVLTITSTEGEANHMYVRSRDGALVMGGRSNFIVLSQSNAADLATAFASYASTGSYT
jgi:hypothetical protein